jgi:hypothetical protein
MSAVTAGDVPSVVGHAMLTLRDEFIRRCGSLAILKRMNGTIAE